MHRGDHNSLFDIAVHGDGGGCGENCRIAVVVVVVEVVFKRIVCGVLVVSNRIVKVVIAV